MVKYILKRLALLIFTLFLVITATFFLMQIMPGTPFNNPKLTPQMIAQLNKAYGLDLPLWQQYLNYLVNAFRGDFGTSFQYQNQSVSMLIGQRLPISAQLGAEALVVGVVAGLFMGAASARNKNNKIDGALGVVSTLGISVPSFILGIILLYLFGFKWPLFPVSGWGDSFSETVLPTIALAVGPAAVVTRFVRSEMIEALSSDYVQLARAKGLSEKEIVNKHAYRNSMIPVLTLIGPTAAGLLTGSTLIENIFSIPGIGQQFVSSIPTKDFPVIMGTTIVYALMLMVMILITDILTAIVDPRVRLQ
ncbi:MULTISPECIES: ABC transporter permease [Leuconostoc]|uniref:Oligopeptide transport system permease protein OppB n=1 Tax=Leuconostoc suionicum TaxID=1511761 RepID=A0A2N9KEW8_9LACO|nr:MULTISPECIES: ABC transporter permease [Leuconostoc]API72854.1 peptide ABC transporter permease [Leuconostoc suionicum]MBE4726899.1 ABC transporter permease [Leuconostoc suionicum]MCT4376240.1 ABC transporter permease [Leuconostoc suionicum]MCT4382520.1 ABC transporter permease [Leuconostoc suionicum]MCT4402722.1 ABC transporter permease [Leuconostoc suionicum]